MGRLLGEVPGEFHRSWAPEVAFHKDFRGCRDVKKVPQYLLAIDLVAEQAFQEDLSGFQSSFRDLMGIPEVL